MDSPRVAIRLAKVSLLRSFSCVIFPLLWLKAELPRAWGRDPAGRLTNSRKAPIGGGPSFPTLGTLLAILAQN